MLQFYLDTTEIGTIPTGMRNFVQITKDAYDNLLDKIDEGYASVENDYTHLMKYNKEKGEMEYFIATFNELPFRESDASQVFVSISTNKKGNLVLNTYKFK